MLHMIFNPLVALGLMSAVLLGIAIWASVTQQGENMEGEDYSYFATKEQQQAREESDHFRHAA
jgi:hypothetical protein